MDLHLRPFFILPFSRFRIIINNGLQERKMTMKFGTIASGSSGNCLYAGNENTHILIDAGVSCKRICEGLKNLNWKVRIFREF